MMGKWYEVTAEIVQVYLVEVADDEDGGHARHVVADELFDFDTLSAEEVAPEHLDVSLRHADKDKIYRLSD
jgi:hypothetical protein